jgi:hypothetical protein
VTITHPDPPERPEDCIPEQDDRDGGLFPVDEIPQSSHQIDLPRY